jgi:hypothetical protein
VLDSHQPNYFDHRKMGDQLHHPEMRQEFIVDESQDKDAGCDQD